MATLPEKFRGCLLGAAVGDVAGAVVEAESPGFIAATYRSVDDILAVDSVEEFTGPAWKVGRFTDDTQMMLCVAQWLLDDPSHSPEVLLAKFAAAHEPWRRYGPGTEAILRMFRQYPDQWRDLATAMFPWGSFGNGSAMRVAPVGLAFFRDLKKVARVAMASSRSTHSHSLGYQAAVLQAVAVATTVSTTEFTAAAFIRPMRANLNYFSDLLQDTSKFSNALDAIEDGLAKDLSCMQMANILGTGITAHESVPMAVYCFLRHPHSYADVIHQAIFIGGDTDTIACMAGAISGAFLGVDAIPDRWRDAVREEKYCPLEIEKLAERLCETYHA